MVGEDELPIKKQWRVDTDLEVLAETLSELVCDGRHQHSNKFDLKETQHYPPEMCRRLLGCLP